MKERIFEKVLFGLSIFFALVASVSVLFVPKIAEIKDVSIIPLYVMAGVFWSGLLLSVAMVIMLDIRRRRWERDRQNKRKLKQKPGIIRIFSNYAASIFDILLLFCVIFLIIGIAFNISKEYYIVILISVALFSFNMHCLLNGKNFRYLLKEKESGEIS